MVVAGALYGMQSLGYIKDGFTTPTEAVEAVAVGLNVTADTGRGDGQVRASDDAGSAAAVQSKTAIMIHICGCVINPGVYELAGDARVYEAIEAAGGFTDEADQNYINLAAPLTDAIKIYIPAHGETVSSDNALGGIYTQADAAAQQSGASRSQDGAGASDASSSGPGTSGGRVNINTADAQMLQTLPGIGPARAADIIAYRQKNGAFACTEDIMKVPGIKSAAYAKIEGMIAVQ